jgi:hypothetical protein
MSRMRNKLKKKVKEIIYEQAKQEVRSAVSEKISNVKKKLRAFFGMGESRNEKVNRITKVYKEKKDIAFQDVMVGVLELYTLNYVQTMAELLSHTVREVPENEKNHNHHP